MRDEDIQRLYPDDEAAAMLQEFRRAKEHKNPLLKEMEEDFDFAVGDQWDPKDVEDLKKVGVHALTINKIQPNIFLLSGIQRQNRTDFRAYPEGEEDGILAEVTTKLMKNTIKRSLGQYKVSEVYEDGIICGEGNIECYIDYTNDLLNGELKIKKTEAFKVFVDPDAIEYDLSDAEYVFKLSTDLSKNQLLKLFPDKEAEIDKLSTRKISVDQNHSITIDTGGDEYEDAQAASGEQIDFLKEKTYDLLEQQYKKYVKKYFIVDVELQTYEEAKSKQSAYEYVEAVNVEGQEPTAKVIERTVPEIWIRSLVGNAIFKDEKSSFYPRWKSFSIIPFYAHRITTKISNREYMVQGVTRGLKDPQREINKRRTQTLRHLNSTANSGWMAEENTYVRKSDWQKYGSSPGILLEYAEGKTPPQRVYPQPLSQGHEYLVKESSEDIKAISGINADLLAQEDKSASGRAIYLRQQQGIVMVQRVLDNFQHTKRLLGLFILSQLGELYTVETAVRVLGSSFIRKNFEVPIHEIAEKISQKMASDPNYQMSQEEAAIVMQVNSSETLPVLDERGEMVMAVDNDAVGAVVNQVLNDSKIGTYDVSVGEAQSSETIKMANTAMLMDLIQNGVPIPPEVIIEDSLLGSETKQQIQQAIQAQQQALAAQQPQ